MVREELKELIQEVYDDYCFVEFNLHFVNEVAPHKVYEIKNNRLNNVLKDTTLVNIDLMATNGEVESMMFYGIDVKYHFAKRMIEETANKILIDIYKVNTRDWFYSKPEPVDIEMTITNWEFIEEKTEIGYKYKLRFEVA
jgi:hypothetical protein